MSKIAILADTHSGVRNNNQSFYIYQDKFYDYMFGVLKKEGIKHIFHLGDVFDRRKEVNFNTLKFVMDSYYRRVKENDIKDYTLVGNHDVVYKSTNRINSPLLLLRSELEDLVWENPKFIEVFDKRLLLVPWINQENKETCLEYIENSPSTIVLGHFEINGFEMHRGVMCDHGLERNIFDKHELVLSGHFHHKSKYNNIQYVGSPFQMTWADYNDERGFHILDVNTLEMTFYPNPHKMFNKIHFNEKTIKNIDLSVYKDTYVKIVIDSKTNTLKLNKFKEALQLNFPADIKVVEEKNESFASNLQLSMSEVEDTLTILNKTIETDTTLNLDKNAVKHFMTSLYNEAVELEI